MVAGDLQVKTCFLHYKVPCRHRTLSSAELCCNSTRFVVFYAAMRKSRQHIWSHILLYSKDFVVFIAVEMNQASVAVLLQYWLLGTRSAAVPA